MRPPQEGQFLKTLKLVREQLCGYLEGEGFQAEEL